MLRDTEQVQGSRILTVPPILGLETNMGAGTTVLQTETPPAVCSTKKARWQQMSLPRAVIPHLPQLPHHVSGRFPMVASVISFKRIGDLRSPTSGDSSDPCPLLPYIMLMFVLSQASLKPC